MKLTFELNGNEMQVDTPDDRRVVDLLREDLGLTGTKEGCGTGECGACTILVDGESRLSCLMLAAQLEGTRVTTVEGLELTPEGTADPSGLCRGGGRAVRFLHAGHGDGGCRAAPARSSAGPRGGSGRVERQPLPLHRVREDRGCGHEGDGTGEWGRR